MWYINKYCILQYLFIILLILFMKESILDKFMTTKWLAWTFWTIFVVMVTALVFYTANLGKETPPIPQEVVSEQWEVLYTYNDIAQGKAYFQEFDLTDWGSMMGMGAYLGPDFSTDFFHNRATTLYDLYWEYNFWKILLREISEQEHIWGEIVEFNPDIHLNVVEQWAVKEMVKLDFKNTFLSENKTIYSEASTIAYKRNVEYLSNMLINGDSTRGYPGGFIKDGQVKTWDWEILTATATEKVRQIAAFVDWSQLVVSSPRINHETGNVENDFRTWSNNWPNEPLID